MSLQQLSSIVRQAAAIAAIVLGALPQTGLPNAVRAPLVAVAGILIAIEHYLSDPSTGNPPKGGPTP